MPTEHLSFLLGYETFVRHMSKPYSHSKGSYSGLGAWLATRAATVVATCGSFLPIHTFHVGESRVPWSYVACNNAWTHATNRSPHTANAARAVPVIEVIYLGRVLSERTFLTSFCWPANSNFGAR